MALWAPDRLRRRGSPPSARCLWMKSRRGSTTSPISVVKTRRPRRRRRCCTCSSGARSGPSWSPTAARGSSRPGPCSAAARGRFGPARCSAVDAARPGVHRRDFVLALGVAAPAQRVARPRPASAPAVRASGLGASAESSADGARDACRADAAEAQIAVAGPYRPSSGRARPGQLLRDPLGDVEARWPRRCETPFSAKPSAMAPAPRRRSAEMPPGQRLVMAASDAARSTSSASASPSISRRRPRSRAGPRRAPSSSGSPRARARPSGSALPCRCLTL